MIVDFSLRIIFFSTSLQSIKETVFYRACVDVSCSSFDYIVALDSLSTNTLNNEN